MSGAATAIVRHHSVATGAAYAVLRELCEYVDDEFAAWPSIKTLAKFAHMSESTCHRALKELQEIGELRINRQAGGRAGTPHYRRTNLYELLVKCPPWCDGSYKHLDSRLTATQEPLWINRVSTLTPPVNVDTRPLSTLTPDPLSTLTPELISRTKEDEIHPSVTNVQTARDPRPEPAYELTADERAQLIAIAKRPRDYTDPDALREAIITEAKTRYTRKAN